MCDGIGNIRKKGNERKGDGHTELNVVSAEFKVSYRQADVKVAIQGLVVMEGGVQKLANGVGKGDFVGKMMSTKKTSMEIKA